MVKKKKNASSVVLEGRVSETQISVCCFYILVFLIYPVWHHCCAWCRYYYGKMHNLSSCSISLFHKTHLRKTSPCTVINNEILWMWSANLCTVKPLSCFINQKELTNLSLFENGPSGPCWGQRKSLFSVKDLKVKQKSSNNNWKQRGSSLQLFSY